MQYFYVQQGSCLDFKLYVSMHYSERTVSNRFDMESMKERTEPFLKI